jgi:predicted ATPase/serine phosphatase RsbU (regulator of sigma subunit)
MLTLPNYQIETKIYDSANSIVYRGIRHSDNQPVILKILKEDYPAPEELARYQQEYDMTQSFNVPGIIKAYNIEKYENFLMIIFEDFGGESLKNLLNSTDQTESSTLKVDNNTLAANLTLPLFPHEKFGGIDRFLRLAIQLADTLGQIHAQCVIHKDINPANIVWNQTTDQIKIIDFGISSRLPRENPTLKNPNQLEGTLAYISPEQTGRMNRSLDYRTDLYSLGVTYYELLTGKLPFESADAMELVHCHIAKIPTPVCEINFEVPQILSDIVIKLMAKNADERYQSALGLKRDLKNCLENMISFKNLDTLSFKLAQKDFSGKLQIPQKLYGRENEVNTLLQAFERVNQGACEMMLVAGYSGVGKTALVYEIHKPMTEKHGYFATGKFEQYQRNIPYSALTQAFNAFCDYLLTESQAQLQTWRENIQKAGGTHGQVLIDVIPTLELIIGKQPAVSQVGPTEAQNRANLVFKSFFQAISQSKHPLVLFIDDLQWIDSASLHLLKTLMTDQDNQYALIIGAYRDNEVDATHPLLITLKELQQAGAIINTLSLQNLSQQDVNALIAESVNSEASLTEPLTALIYEKTQGNPFFTIEFLKSLHEKGLLEFDDKIYQWQWDINQIKALNITDNVVELMANKIRQLAKPTQNILKFAASLGNQFDLDTLTMIAECPTKEGEYYLFETLTGGLLFMQKDYYQFVHDRVQQAAYALIPNAEKPALHWRIGQLLLNRPQMLEKQLLYIVDHLNQGTHLVIDQEERDSLAYLNLQAANKAIASFAYKMGNQYAKQGLAWLGANNWSRQYEFTLALYEAVATTSYLCGRFAEAMSLSNTVIEHGKTLLDVIKMYELQMDIEAAQLHTPQALQLGVEIINKLGISLVKTPLANLELEHLLELPPMTDPSARAALRILSKCVPAAYQTDLNLLLQVVYTMVHLNVTYGNEPNSAFGYVMYGLVLSGSAETMETGYRFGKLGLQILEKYPSSSLECRVKHIFYSHICFTTLPLHETLKPMQTAAQMGLVTGDFEFVTYISNVRGIHFLFSGKPLEDVNDEYEQLLKLMKKLQIEHGINLASIFKQLVLTLTGKSEVLFQLIGSAFDETKMLPIFIEANQLNLLSFTYVSKLMLCFIMDNKPAALEHVTTFSNKKYVQGLTSQYLYVEYHFYESLTLLAMYFTTMATEQAQFLSKVEANQQQMKQWATHCPTNYQQMYALVEAEKAKILKQPWQASEWYEQAIQASRRHQVLHLEALAYELASTFYLEHNKEKIAKLYLKEAHYFYQQWGAAAKVKQLEEKYPRWLAKKTAKTRFIDTQTTFTQTIEPTITFTPKTLLAEKSFLDLITVMKASQAISSEIQLDNLIKIFMRIVLENVGAEQGCLMLNQRKTGMTNSFQLLIEAYATLEQVDILNALPLDALLLENNQGVNLSQAIVNYTARTQSVVVLNDATHEGAFTHDPYVKQTQPKSVLSFPINYQNQLYGLFYLENNQTTGAFTQDRVSILTMLSSQIAISLENAQYANHLEEKVKQRTAQLALANEQITHLNEQLKQENLRMSAELNVAKQLQQMVLPKKSEFEQIENLDIAGFMAPADEVGGDYYEILNHNGHIKIGIGDVTGHGLESGVLMLMVQTTVRALLLAGIDNPEQFLNILNQTIYHNAQRMGTDKNLTLSLLDYQNGCLQLTGQHEDVLLVRQNGQIERIDTFDLGFMIGIKRDILKFASHQEISLQPGDGIVLYTDGITEAQNELEEQYGIERLCEVISRHWDFSAQEIQTAMINDVRQFIGRQKVFDDLTLLILKQK